MSDIKIQQLEVLLGGVDKIVFALDINDLPEEAQLKVIERFSAILFKRILLRVPKEKVEEVKKIFKIENGSNGLESLVEILRGAIPDFDECVKEEFDTTLSDFRKQ